MGLGWSNQKSGPWMQRLKPGCLGRPIGPMNAPVVQPHGGVEDVTLGTHLWDLLADENGGRAAALAGLCEFARAPEKFPDLAPVLWYSYGATLVFLHEIIDIYPKLKTPTALTVNAVTRACHCLELIKSLASHPETKTLLMQSQLPMLLYPFLNTRRDRAYQRLRIQALNVMAVLVKVDHNEEATRFLMHTEIFPLLLCSMENGEETSKVVAAYTAHRLLLNRSFLDYICRSAERFYAVAMVLAKTVDSLVENPWGRLLHHVICCHAYRMELQGTSWSRWIHYLVAVFTSLLLRPLQPSNRCRISMQTFKII